MNIKKQLKKVKTVSLKKAKALAWKAFSDYIRERDNWKCFTCGQLGSGSGIHCGHFIPKSIGGPLLKFNVFNAHAQCYRCNRHLDGYGAMYARKLRLSYPGAHIEDMLFDMMDASRAFKANPEWYMQTKTLYERLLLELKKKRQKASNEV